MKRMTRGPQRLAIVSWLALGLTLVAWLMFASTAPRLPVTLILTSAWVALLLAMIFSARNAFAYSMLASIIYTSVGTMELMSQPRSFAIAVVFACVALLTFFAVIPATRFERRADKLL